MGKKSDTPEEKMENKATVFDREKYSLAEGPFYDERFKRYSWVDITKGRLWTLKDGKKECFELGQPLGAAIPMPDSEGFILAAMDGIYSYAGGKAELLQDLNTNSFADFENKDTLNKLAAWFENSCINAKRGKYYDIPEIHNAWKKHVPLLDKIIEYDISLDKIPENEADRIRHTLEYNEYITRLIQEHEFDLLPVPLSNNSFPLQSRETNESNSIEDDIQPDTIKSEEYGLSSDTEDFEETYGEPEPSEEPKADTPSDSTDDIEIEDYEDI